MNKSELDELRNSLIEPESEYVHISTVRELLDHIDSLQAEKNAIPLEELDEFIHVAGPDVVEDRRVWNAVVKWVESFEDAP